MNLNEVKTLLTGTIKQAFTNKKTLDKFDGSSGTLKYNGVPVNNVPVFVADDSPVGNIIAFMGNTAPKDYLICDGSEYNIADYPLLVQHFIDEFGSANYFGGDGVDTFAVPDLRGEFLRGTGTATRNSGSGTSVGKHQDGTLHLTNGVNANGSFNTYPSDASDNVFLGNVDTWNKLGNTVKGYNIKSDSTFSTTIVGQRFTSRPTNTSVLYCIKYQITQNNISKDMVNYSLEEQVIGSWIDGKPLYQKTIESTLPATTKDGTVVTIVINIPDTNIEKCICINGFFESDTGICTTPFITNAGYFTKLYLSGANKDGVTIINGYKAFNNLPIYITLQYTKTTDAENSFTPDMLSSIKMSEVVTDEDVNDVIGGI